MAEQKKEEVAKKENTKTIEEIKKPTGKSKGEKPKKNPLLADIPLYLAILFLVLGLVGGYSLRIITEPEEPFPLLPENGSNGAISLSVNARLIYSDQCKMCGRNNTFELVLISAGIPYEMERIEAASPEGIRLVSNYNVKTIPTILIDENSIGPDITAQTKDGETKKLKDVLRPHLIRDKYIIPEMGFDQRSHPKMYLMQLEGCSVAEGKISVEIFSDPYDLVEIQYKPEIEEALRDFNEMIDFHYNYLASYSADVLYPMHGKDDTTLAAEFIHCASEQGKYLEFDRGVMGIYCNKGSIDETTDIELQTCSVANDHLDLPLTQAEIDNVIEWTELDLNKLNECRTNISERFAESKEKSKRFGVEITPSALVDCRYLILTPNLKNILCEIMPATIACIEEAEE